MSEAEDVAHEIRETPFEEALGERYLSYALSTIMARSLPDVRDGLKPVHRRLLYAMRQLRLDPNSAYKKSARVVGDVIGQYHPHGDQAVYDALVRLAQEFAQRYPLIDGQGNFGNVDGDGAAAMRYTEARLTDVARAMLVGLDADAVDFRPTYDGEAEEPVVLPAGFPNLLANGAAGIAVGMASNIPPHNAGEVCEALLAKLNKPSATTAELAQHIPGPDFPTGGELVEDPETVQAAYAAGRGALRVRGRWHVEKHKGGTYSVVVTEIPYQVQKARLIERLADLITRRKLPLVADIRDESTADVRLVLEPKSRNVEAQTLMESVFRSSELETRFQLNMNVLDKDGVPQVMSLAGVLDAYLDHRFEVLVRRSRHRLARIDHRLEVLDGLLAAYLNLDEVIRIIRDNDQPKPVLMEQLTITDTQAEAILNMRLRALRKLEEMEIRREHEKLTKEKAELEALLADGTKQRRAIRDEIKQIKADFGDNHPLGKRRTTIGQAPQGVDVPLEAQVEREPVTVLISAKGWVRAVKGHLGDASEMKYKEGDSGRFALHAYTTDKLVVLSSDGRAYTVGVDKLPRGRGYGEPLRLMVDMTNEADIAAARVHRPGKKLLLVSRAGRGFIVEEDSLLAAKRGGKQVMTPGAGDTPLAALAAEDGDHVAVIGTNRRLLVFPLEEVPAMNRGRGVRLQKYKDAQLADIKLFWAEQGLTWQLGQRERRQGDIRPWLAKRGQVGRMPPNGFPKKNIFGDGVA